MLELVCHFSGRKIFVKGPLNLLGNVEPNWYPLTVISASYCKLTDTLSLPVGRG